MAQKRMFDSAIIDTDRFMDMPLSAKAIYFLMGMEADNEGFVSPKKILKLHGGNDDDIKILIIKGFIIPFESGVVVITDWNNNNYLDKNRIRQTEYQKERQMLVLTTNKKYELNNRLTNVQPVEKRRVEKRRVEITTTSVVDAPFIVEDELQKLESKENSPLDIIATFIRKKGLVIENKKQLQLVIRRYVKIANQLSGAYTNKQIFDAAKKIILDNESRDRRSQDTIDWTLETVFKQLTK